MSSRGHGEVQVFFLPFSELPKCVRGACHYSQPSFRKALQQRAFCLLLTATAACDWRGLLSFRTPAGWETTQDWGSQHQGGASCKDNAEYPGSQSCCLFGEKCVKYIWHKLVLPQNLWARAVKRVAITQIYFIKDTWRNKSKIDDPRSPCILSSAVECQLEENTRPNSRLLQTDVFSLK